MGRLDRTIAARTDIGVTSGTEFTKWAKPAEFTRTIATFTSDKEEVAKEARRHTDAQLSKPS